MIRLYVICEGQTEESFIKEVVAPTLYERQIYLCPRLVGKPGHQGGNVKIERIVTDARNLLAAGDAWCTTFFDFYGLPNAFPGKAQAQQSGSPDDKADCVLNAMQAALTLELGENAMRRFIPYLQMYEFEGLLFSDPVALAQGTGDTRLAAPFQRIRAQFSTPEWINDSPHTAPAKRIQALFPSYDKPLHGVLAAREAGLDRIRAECRRFDAWLSRIEALADPVAA
ncbi:DUF4276 family protein [Amantichitinum ursilacus]|uniref:DUF4276 domain-containing protein n=1 Tax=Amantichitinum ursilacus TaxID=857265 RepID=A0A0N1JRY7_9NEIS|nr:DUF4276 family protein [Amantichitinum ursilacus]KPC50408.1 hypothetical protein WG78_17410 [Amantichitinum ursilacus]